MTLVSLFVSYTRITKVIQQFVVLIDFENDTLVGLKTLLDSSYK